MAPVPPFPTPSRQRGTLVHHVNAMVAGLHLGQSCHCRPGEARPRKSVEGLLHRANRRAGQQGASWANHGVSGGRTGLDWRVDAATIIRERKKWHGRRPSALVPHPAFCDIGENRRPVAHAYAQLLAWWWYYATLLGRTGRIQAGGARFSIPKLEADAERVLGAVEPYKNRFRLLIDAGRQHFGNDLLLLRRLNSYMRAGN